MRRNNGGGIMEALWSRNHGKRIMEEESWRGIKQYESRRRQILEEEASKREDSRKRSPGATSGALRCQGLLELEDVCVSACVCVTESARVWVCGCVGVCCAPAARMLPKGGWTWIG